MKITKKTVLLAREPIAQTSDGTVKVMTATDNGQSETFTYGHLWKLGGSGFYTGYPEGRFSLDSADIAFGDGEDAKRRLSIEVNLQQTEMELGKIEDTDPIPAGTYPNAKIEVSVTDNVRREWLVIPVKLVVEE